VRNRDNVSRLQIALGGTDLARRTEELFRDVRSLLEATEQRADYDDLLLYWRHMLEEPVVVGQRLGRIRSRPVDEYQDTNSLQAAILLRIETGTVAVSPVVRRRRPIDLFISPANAVRKYLDFPSAFLATGRRS